MAKNPGSLNYSQIAVLNDMLVMEKLKIENSLKSSRRSTVPPSQLKKQTKARVIHLKEIEKALKRIENGGYGKCSACRGAVSYKSLLSDPTGSCCTECQTHKSSSQALGKTTSLAGSSRMRSASS